MGKTYGNTPKGRFEIPKKPGAYNLRNKRGVVIYTGMTNNLKRRIKEHSYDKSKQFTSITITATKTKSQANKLENKRLHSKKLPYNKTKE